MATLTSGELETAARNGGADSVYEINERPLERVSWDWDWDVIVIGMDDVTQFERELPVEVERVAAKSCDDGYARLVVMLREVEG